MIKRTQGLFQSEVGVSRLESLLVGIGRAAEEGRLREAIRLADCTCRIAPADLSCSLVHARLLIKLGAASEALDRLRVHQEPDALVARGEALWVQGAVADSAICVSDLLGRFAADSIEQLQYLASRLCRPPANFSGWIGVDTRLRLVGAVRIGVPVAIEYAGRTCYPLISALDRDGMALFELEIPAGFCGQIRAYSDDIPLLGSGLVWPPDFNLYGWVVLENEALVGKARLEWAPTLPTTIAVAWPGGNQVLMSMPVDSGESLRPFSVPLNGRERDASQIEVSVVLPDGGHEPLAGSPIRLPATSPTPIGIRPKRQAHTVQDHSPRTKQIDIIVPVYTGFTETLRCLEGVLATTTRAQAQVVVINDASPDAALSEALVGLAQAGRITLLTNRCNRGFPGSANVGMNLHPERDVVLLNSDAEVCGDWLDRLRFAAYSADDVGTVTPLGETASIMSYPGGNQPHSQLDCSEIDLIAREVNARKLIELPVGVGFCLYVRRACLDEVGKFDESSFGKGYGEENDFCLRARRRGWRHIGAADLFVGHRGGRSYGRLKEILLERNRRILEALHPGYEAFINRFVAEDPMLDARRAIDTYRLFKEAAAPVLLVTLGLPGGVKRHVDLRQAELRAAGHSVLILQPSGIPDKVHQTLLITQNPELENLAYNLPDETPILRALLLGLGLEHIELHHFVGLPPAAPELVAKLGIPYDVYVHDYSWICPRIRFLGGNGSYCGEPPVKDCEECIQTHGSELEDSLTVAALRARSDSILRGARTVIAPCNDVRGRFARYFPDLPVTVVAWEPQPIQLSRGKGTQGERIRVAVIGALSIHKGHQVLLQCARDAAERNLNLDFILIGYTCDDDCLLATGRVFITGPYSENEIGTLLEREECHIAFFPAPTPETWCYALTHAMRYGLPIAAFDLGAIAERLSAYGSAELLPLSAKAAEINSTLIELAQRFNEDVEEGDDMND